MRDDCSFHTPTQGALLTDVQSAVAWLKRHGTKRNREGMARYGLPSTNALGVSVGDIRLLGKQLGRHHELALALWQTGIFEARMLTAFVADPKLVTPAQMDAWCRDFDNWASATRCVFTCSIRHRMRGRK